MSRDPCADHCMDELLAVAVQAASELPADRPDPLVAELVLALASCGRIADATDRLRPVAPWLAGSLAEWSNRSVWAAGALLPYVALAELGGDADVSARLRSELLTLCRAARRDVTEVPSLAVDLMHVAHAMHDEVTSRWLNGLEGDARLALDSCKLGQLKAKGDSSWEALFDAVEARVEDLGPKYQEQTYRALLRCGLARAAYRHWSRTDLHLDATLLAALWSEGLERQYQTMVDSVQRRWVESPPRDWTWVGTAVALAIAREDAGDSEGALASAMVARDLAEENVSSVMQSAIPPEVAIWSLAKLIPLATRLGDESAAQGLLQRCLSLLEAPMPEGVARSWRNSRETTHAALHEAFTAAGWDEEAMRFAGNDKTRLRHQLAIALNKGNGPVATRALFESIPHPRKRLGLALREAASQIGSSPTRETWQFPTPRLAQAWASME